MWITAFELVLRDVHTELCALCVFFIFLVFIRSFVQDRTQSPIFRYVILIGCTCNRNQWQISNPVPVNLSKHDYEFAALCAGQLPLSSNLGSAYIMECDTCTPDTVCMSIDVCACVCICARVLRLLVYTYRCLGIIRNYQ